MLLSPLSGRCVGQLAFAARSLVRLLKAFGALGAAPQVPSIPQTPML